MINHNQLRELIIKPVLYDLLLDSPNAEELILFTCAAESLGGYYLKQVKGPALGIYQMEPNTYNDIWRNYINNNQHLLMIMASKFDAARIPDEQRLIYDLRYATAITALHYHRVRSPLPPSTDLELIWEYYKKYYNTSLGKAEKNSSIQKYHSFIKG